MDFIFEQSWNNPIPFNSAPSSIDGSPSEIEFIKSKKRLKILVLFRYFLISFSLSEYFQIKTILSSSLSVDSGWI